MFLVAAPDDAESMVGDGASAWQRHKAARTAAGCAHDAADLAELLDMLGLAAEDGLEQPVEPEPEQLRKPTPTLDRARACRLDNLLRANQSRRFPAPR